MDSAQHPDKDKLDEISAGYDRLMLGYTRRVGAITAKGDWHLRLPWSPDGRPEVVWDRGWDAYISCRTEPPGARLKGQRGIHGRGLVGPMGIECMAQARKRVASSRRRVGARREYTALPADLHGNGEGSL